MNKIINILENINKNINVFELKKRIEELEADKRVLYRKYTNILNKGLARQARLDEREKELNEFQVKINEQVLKLEIVNKLKK